MGLCIIRINDDIYFEGVLNDLVETINKPIRIGWKGLSENPSNRNYENKGCSVGRFIHYHSDYPWLDGNIVYSSSLLAKGFFPETHIQMMNKIRIKIRIAVMNAVPFSPKNFNEVKKSIGCIIARRSKNGVLSVLSPIERYNLFSNINDWAALPLLMRKSITLPMWYNVIMGTVHSVSSWSDLAWPSICHHSFFNTFLW